VDTARTAALSDGTFAVAMTLLIFDVRLPAGSTPALGHDLWFREWPHYLGYVVSFAVVGTLWLSHHTVFRQLSHLDHTEIVLNLVMLSFVVFIPFPTELVAAYIAHASRTDQGFVAAFYGVILAAATFMLALLWHHAAAKRRLIRHSIDDATARVLTRRLYLTPVLYLGATGLALIDLRLGFIAYLVIACGYLLHTGTRVLPKEPRPAHHDAPVAPLDRLQSGATGERALEPPDEWGAGGRPNL
jgi:uncharacterized membrane protein